MPDFNIALNNGSQGIANYDTSKIFVFGNRYSTETYTNSSGATVTLLTGAVMGRIAATGLIVPFSSAATDGSQNPLGVLANDITLAAGGTIQAPLCIGGDVIADKLIFQNADTLNTIISGRIVKDLIRSNSGGIKIVFSNEMTDFDNQ